MAIPKDFGFGEEEQMVRDSARKFLRDNAPIDKLRTLVAASPEDAYESDIQGVAWDERVWKDILALGWTALGVSEQHGGAGMKTVAVAALAEELGRVALPSPLTSTMIATAVLEKAALEAGAAGAYLERIAAGTTASLAATARAGDGELEATDVRADGNGNGNGFKLSGEAVFVQDARKVDFFVVAARTEAGTAICVVNADAPGLSIVADQIVDLTRDQAHLVFDNVEVEAAAVVAAAGEGGDVLLAATPTALVVIAADLCGAAEWQLQTTAAYARTRRQFDHEIGFFQAVKHPIVNMMIDIDRARSLTYAAAAAIDAEPPSALRLARMAKAAAADAGAFCSDRSVQLHGGIGFTWECDIHIYFKRQKHSQFLYGDSRHQRAELAELFAD